MEDFLRHETTIKNVLGLHARAAAKMVKLCEGFGAEIFVEKDGMRANAKSIMGILMLAASRGTTILILARGDDAPRALEAVAGLVDAKFGEE